MAAPASRPTADTVTMVIHDAAIVTVDDRDRCSTAPPSRSRVTHRRHRTERRAAGPLPGAERIGGSGQDGDAGFANAHAFTMTPARGVFEDLAAASAALASGGLSPILPPGMTPENGRTMAPSRRARGVRAAAPPWRSRIPNNVDDYAGALADTGMRFPLGERAHDRVGTEIGDPAPYQLDRALGSVISGSSRIRSTKNGKADGRLRIAVSAWHLDMCSPELLQDLRALQQRLDTRATIHLNQIWARSRPSRRIAIACRPSIWPTLAS